MTVFIFVEIVVEVVFHHVVVVVVVVEIEAVFVVGADVVVTIIVAKVGLLSRNYDVMISRVAVHDGVATVLVVGGGDGCCARCWRFVAGRYDNRNAVSAERGVHLKIVAGDPVKNAVVVVLAFAARLVGSKSYVVVVITIIIVVVVVIVVVTIIIIIVVVVFIIIVVVVFITIVVVVVVVVVVVAYDMVLFLAIQTVAVACVTDGAF